jgi:hypothetical protein
VDLAPAQDGAVSAEARVNLVRNAGGLRATVSADSVYSGYGIAILSDGTWIEKGNESAGGAWIARASGSIYQAERDPTGS